MSRDRGTFLQAEQFNEILGISALATPAVDRDVQGTSYSTRHKFWTNPTTPKSPSAPASLNPDVQALLSRQLARNGIELGDELPEHSSAGRPPPLNPRNDCHRRLEGGQISEQKSASRTREASRSVNMVFNLKMERLVPRIYRRRSRREIADAKFVRSNGGACDVHRGTKKRVSLTKFARITEPD